MVNFKKHYIINHANVSWNYRITLYDIFNKLSTDDLISIFNIYTKLWIQWPCLSFAVEILEDRWILDR